VGTKVHDLATCKRRALKNLITWYFSERRVYRVWPNGTVFHPTEHCHLAALNFPLIFGRPVIITERFIHIFVPRRTQRWTEYWTGNRNRNRPRFRKITIDTDRQRRVVGDGIIAPRGRVIYAAGPRVDYRALVQAHIITAVIEGVVDPFGDPVIPESPSNSTPESTVE
jgi:hypothetical protein